MMTFPQDNETETRIKGLSTEEVQERIRQGKDNRADVGTGLTTGEIIRSNTFTYFNFIFLIITILLCLVGSLRNLTLLRIPVLVFFKRFVQNIPSKK